MPQRRQIRNQRGIKKLRKLGRKSRNRSKTGFSPGGAPGGGAQVLDFVGGPSGTRNLGPLIKSQIKGIAQVVDKRAIPSSLLVKHRLRSLPHLVSLCRFTPRSVSLSNTYLTPGATAEISANRINIIPQEDPPPRLTPGVGWVEMQ